MSSDGGAGQHRLAPGDLFVRPETADVLVEWAVIEATEGGVVVVAADTDPSVGTGDVDVAPSDAAGALVLRCAIRAQLPSVSVDAALHSGRLETAAVDRARAMLASLDGGQEAEPVSRRRARTDETPSYQDRLDELRAARRALLGVGPALAGQDEVSQEHQASGSVPERAKRPLAWWPRVAAAVLAVSLGGLLAWQAQRIGELEETLSSRRDQAPAFVALNPRTVYRGETPTVRIDEELGYVVVYLVLPAGAPDQETFVLEAVSRGKVVARAVAGPAPEGDAVVAMLPGTALGRQRVEIRLRTAEGEAPLARYDLVVDHR